MKNYLCFFALFIFIVLLLGCASPLQLGIDAYSKGDYDLAAKHWRPIAEGGDKNAQYDMGVLYEHGYGSLKKDLDVASDWYLRAVKQGNVRAMYRLGVVYELQNNDVRAVNWYTFAARWGSQEAIQQLSEMGQPIPSADLLHQKQQNEMYARQKTAAFLSAFGAALSQSNQYNQQQYNKYNNSSPYSYQTQSSSVGHTGSSSLTCGLQPIPNIGCRIGRCVDGHWEQICDSSPTLTCGIKPIPNIGCRIGRCVDGHWEQICDSSPTLTCGIKPIPNVGCSIGGCVDGHWEQVCN